MGKPRKQTYEVVVTGVLTVSGTIEVEASSPGEARHLAAIADHGAIKWLDDNGLETATPHTIVGFDVQE